MTLVLVATLAAPPVRHDFSGRWTLDASSPASADAALALLVDQPDWTRRNVRGEPIPPTHPDFSVRREGPSGTTTDMYLMGLIGGFIGGAGYFDSKGKWTAADPPQAVWHGDTLTLLPRRGPRTEDWSERRESWSLDADGRLRVEVVTEANDHAQQTTLLRYRRE